MPEFDARRVLAAFFEKGWLLYEEHGDCHEPLLDRLTGPVDNLVPGVLYRVAPVTPDPDDIDEVCNTLDISSARVALFFDHPEGGRTQIAGLSVRDGIATFEPFSHLAFPADELEAKVREHVSTFRYR